MRRRDTPLAIALSTALAAAVLAGCASVSERAGERLGSGAQRVCDMTPAQRDLAREWADKHAHPHTVRVRCYTAEAAHADD